MDINDIEIFAVGKWRPGNSSKPVIVTERDLDDMVESFNSLSVQNGFAPALKLGHTETEKYFGDGKGAPRLGTVSKIWRVGTKILANFQNVPEALVDLIRKDRYNQVSVEVYPTYEYDGKQYRNLLSAVALLGAELPAVKGLKDLASSLFESFDEDQDRVEYTQEIEMPTYDQDQHNALVAAEVTRTEKECETKFAAERAALTEVNDSQAEEIKTLREENEALKAEKATFAEKAAKKEIEDMVDAAIKEGRVLPKQKEGLIAMANSMQAVVKFDDGKSKTRSEMFQEHLNSLPKQADFSEKGSGEGEGDGDESAGAELHRKTLAKQKEIGKTYGEARTLVLEEDPDLKLRYSQNPV